MTGAAKPPLLICRHGAWTMAAATCMELTLTAGVFEQKPVLVLLDAAVTLLLPNQNGESSGLKTLAKQIPALELYGIEHVHVEAAALIAHGIDAAALDAGVKPLAPGALAALVAAAGAVLVF